jgi:hypothetical protein
MDVACTTFESLGTPNGTIGHIRSRTRTSNGALTTRNGAFRAQPDDVERRIGEVVQTGREAPNVRGDPAGLRTTELFDRDGDRALHDDQPRTTSW